MLRRSRATCCTGARDPSQGIDVDSSALGRLSLDAAGCGVRSLGAAIERDLDARRYRLRREDDGRAAAPF